MWAHACVRHVVVWECPNGCLSVALFTRAQLDASSQRGAADQGGSASHADPGPPVSSYPGRLVCRPSPCASPPFAPFPPPRCSPFLCCPWVSVAPSWPVFWCSGGSRTHTRARRQVVCLAANGGVTVDPKALSMSSDRCTLRPGESESKWQLGHPCHSKQLSEADI